MSTSRCFWHQDKLAIAHMMQSACLLCGQLQGVLLNDMLAHQHDSCLMLCSCVQNNAKAASSLNSTSNNVLKTDDQDEDILF